MRKVAGVLLMLLGSVTVLGCADICLKLDDATVLAGEYESRTPFSISELTLFANGTYTQKVRMYAEDKPLEATGSWRVNVEKKQIFIARCFSIVNGFGELRSTYNEPIDGYVVLQIQGGCFRRVRLGVADGFPYDKLE